LTPVSSLFEFLARARRRCISHLLLDRVVLALGVGFAASIVILLAGSAALNWMWTGVAVVVALIAGFILLRRKLPNEYVVAQRVDRKLSLADTLSTAAYFSGTSEDAAPPVLNTELREAQLHRAEELARIVDLKRALPIQRPRALYPAAALALVAIGVLLLRVAVFGSFDTHASLLNTLAKSLFGTNVQQAKTDQKQEGPADPADGDTVKREQEKNSDFAGDPASDSSDAADARDKQEQGASDKEAADQQGGDPTQANPGDQPDAKNGDKAQDGQESANGQQNQDPSMLEKIKEALSDMLNKMKPQQNQNSKNQKGQKGDQQNAQQNQAQANQDQQGDDADSQSNGRQSADGEAEGDQAQGQKSEDAKSGVGDQEGDKALRDAAALKAMGKISELFGKRAENVTGSVMMEVGSTKQQLKTAVVQRNASHAEAGSEIHRDEVPMMYEQFVQQYFEQIRKPSSPSPAAKAQPGAGAPQR